MEGLVELHSKTLSKNEQQRKRGVPKSPARLLLTSSACPPGPSALRPLQGDRCSDLTFTVLTSRLLSFHEASVSTGHARL